jgi:hypothetical protein
MRSCIHAPLIDECYANLEGKLVDAKMATKYNFFILEGRQGTERSGQETPANDPSPRKRNLHGGGQDDWVAFQDEMGRSGVKRRGSLASALDRTLTLGRDGEGKAESLRLRRLTFSPCPPSPTCSGLPFQGVLIGQSQRRFRATTSPRFSLPYANCSFASSAEQQGP